MNAYELLERVKTEFESKGMGILDVPMRNR